MINKSFLQGVTIYSVKVFFYILVQHRDLISFFIMKRDRSRWGMTLVSDQNIWLICLTNWLIIPRIRWSVMLNEFQPEQYSFWLSVLIMSLTYFRVNLHSVVAWMSRNSLLETRHQKFKWLQRGSNLQRLSLHLTVQFG